MPHALAAGPLTMANLFVELGVDHDPRWAALSMIRLEESGQIGFTGCDHGNDHSRTCSVALNS